MAARLFGGRTAARQRHAVAETWLNARSASTARRPRERTAMPDRPSCSFSDTIRRRGAASAGPFQQAAARPARGDARAGRSRRCCFPEPPRDSPPLSCTECGWDGPVPRLHYVDAHLPEGVAAARTATYLRPIPRRCRRMPSLRGHRRWSRWVSARRGSRGRSQGSFRGRVGRRFTRQGEPRSGAFGAVVADFAAPRRRTDILWSARMMITKGFDSGGDPSWGCSMPDNLLNNSRFPGRRAGLPAHDAGCRPGAGAVARAGHGWDPDLRAGASG